MRLIEYPARLADLFLPAIDAVAARAFGGQQLSEAVLSRSIRGLSEIYTRQRAQTAAVASDESLLQARLRFFLPRDLPKVQGPLHELVAAGALPRGRELRVLDVGAGLGASGLGAAELLLRRRAATRRVRIDALDRDPRALSIYAQLAEELASAHGLALEVQPIETSLPALSKVAAAEPYDLVLIGFVLNELAAAAPPERAVESGFSLLSRLAALLREDGALIVLEPALHAQSRALQAVRDRFAAAAGPPHVFAPCVHRASCPMLRGERDWCHERLPVGLPEPLAPLARAAGLRQGHLSFSYLTLHRVPRSLAELGAGRSPLRVVSAARKSKGKLELYLCDASGLRVARRLDRDASPNNAALEAAGRGDLIQLAPAPTAEAKTLRVLPATSVSLLYDAAAAHEESL